jgi:hypothetical protein
MLGRSQFLVCRLLNSAVRNHAHARRIFTAYFGCANHSTLSWIDGGDWQAPPK